MATKFRLHELKEFFKDAIIKNHDHVLKLIDVGKDDKELLCPNNNLHPDMDFLLILKDVLSIFKEVIANGNFGKRHVFYILFRGEPDKTIISFQTRFLFSLSHPIWLREIHFSAFCLGSSMNRLFENCPLEAKLKIFDSPSKIGRSYNTIGTFDITIGKIKFSELIEVNGFLQITINPLRPLYALERSIGSDNCGKVRITTKVDISFPCYEINSPYNFISHLVFEELP